MARREDARASGFPSRRCWARASTWFPTALVALGVGILVLAIAPRRAGLAVYAVIIWSLVIDLAASLISGLQWLERFSLYHYMALVPAGSADLRTLAITTTVAVALCAVGVVLFRRRDLQLT